MAVNHRNILRIPGRLASIFRTLMQYGLKGGIVNASIVTINYGEILKDKRVLVTGGSHGIGFAIARKFIDCGAMVVVTGRNEVDLRAASASIASNRLHWVAWDVADIGLADKKLDDVETICGGEIDVLVNNAGILIAESFPDVSESGWDKVYAVNSKGLFFLTQAVCRRWISRGKRIRKVINISSTSGFLPGAYPYRMSKWDVVGMTRGLGLNLSPQGIIVNGIAPGRTAGRMLDIRESNLFDANVPMGRSALPEEIAELATFLACDASNYIVGQTIICDGGYTLRSPNS